MKISVIIFFTTFCAMPAIASETTITSETSLTSGTVALTPDHTEALRNEAFQKNLNIYGLGKKLKEKKAEKPVANKSTRRCTIS